MVTLRVSPEDAIRQLMDRIEAINTIPRTPQGIEYYDFIRWCSKTWQVADAIYGSDDPHAEELRTMTLQNCACDAHMKAVILAGAYQDRLLGFIREIEDGMAGAGTHQ
ncbi:MAG: hypothetical protein GYA23_10060 [Methanomicrobiales archaeon]|nr:hypothetical protein [Methanomicrobiales archaeon]